MKTQRTFQPDASPALAAYVVLGACATLLCLVVWLLAGWQLALLLFLGVTAHLVWKLVLSTPEVRSLASDRWQKVRHA